MLGLVTIYLAKTFGFSMQAGFDKTQGSFSSFQPNRRKNGKQPRERVQFRPQIEELEPIIVM